MDDNFNDSRLLPVDAILHHTSQTYYYLSIRYLEADYNRYKNYHVGVTIDYSEVSGTVVRTLGTDCIFLYD